MRPPDDPQAFFESYVPGRFAELEISAGSSSPGSVVAVIPGQGKWSLRVDQGRLEVSPGEREDAILRVTVAEEDFRALVVEGARAEAALAADAEAYDKQRRSAERALRQALSIDAETAELVRRVPGSVVIRVVGPERTLRLGITPARSTLDFDRPECTVDVGLEDLERARAEGSSPGKLFSDGKLRLGGQVQIAMALASILT